MPAAPQDIARYTTDGVLVTHVDNDIKTLHINAVSLIDNEIETFFADPADAQVLLDEAFALRSAVNPPAFAVEFPESLGLGTTIPITPNVPGFTVLDDVRGVRVPVRARAFVREMQTDRFQVELLGPGIF